MTSKQEREQKAEEMAKTARKIAEKSRRDRQIPNEKGVHNLPVLTATEDGETVTFTVLLGRDIEREVSVPYPDDTQDSSEPLVRLFNWKDIQFENFTDIDKIPVYTDGTDAEYRMCVPEEESSISKSLFLSFPSLFCYSPKNELSAVLRPSVLFTVSLISFSVAGALYMITDSLTELTSIQLLSQNTLMFFLLIFSLLLALKSLWVCTSNYLTLRSED
jgi:hypothetical protein